MPKHDPFSPKAVANRIKAKGLQRLRWYCQMCEKQCRDENGFKCHCASESHQRQMAIFTENPERYVEQFSQEFEDAFLSILSRRYGTKKVLANQVYQEIVADRQHLHMNATQWDTLGDFVKHLGRAGKCRVEDSERGWMIEWIDVSPEALARKAAIQKKERQAMDDEQVEHRLLREQMKRAKQLRPSDDTISRTAYSRSESAEVVKLDAGKPIRFGLKTMSKHGSSGINSFLKPAKPSLKAGKGFVKSNPFKKATGSLSVIQSSNTDGDGCVQGGTAPKQPPKKMTAVEEIMQQELRHKEARRTRSRSPSRNNRRRSQSPM
ncbi:hypothetical protein COEREDRAFT_80039 [Coemansia reversa NRRL 1564]|uniref:DNA/RNA-binding protein Kin17 WH-like domain-containing protein n=1 Tax=Coemansia reversa (strain ATCC 12441 / NRRL 1564) TaxID=763665 RepID=A0A2G5BGE2_COERN|nr:hypothetical protein COEREDRAFT_80039 [Coemansia reversa NRRL 1564]|eukprot:PIA18098.1 hypothetical protein COEREDRAFT_80039 [Coemansia reversa NRRL 1564]